MMYQIGICDDDMVFTFFLKEKILKNAKSCVSVKTADSGEDFLKLPGITEFNLVFIDIVLCGIDGIEVATRFRNKNKDAVIVLCSGLKAPIPECFFLEVHRYIMKNNILEMEEGIKSGLEKMEQVFGKKYYIVKNREGFKNIPVDKIMCILRDRNGSRLILSNHTSDGREAVKISKKLEDVYAELMKIPGCCFGYPHNSYLVNVYYVQKIRKTYLTLENGEEMNISRDRYASFCNVFLQAAGKETGYKYCGSKLRHID